MWVLVLFIGLSGGPSPSSVPGYKTEQICNDIGREYVRRVTAGTSMSGSFLCIPGPAQQERTSGKWAGEN